MFLTSNEIRQKFLDYFSKKKHTVFPSAPLIPKNDSSILFSNAGMVPFKSFFINPGRSNYPRITSCQKCFRVSGKHNDFNKVGHTPRHHTFFEMLGNFSFGDYFKKESIYYAWELLTEIFKLNPQKLWISVFKDDHETKEIWQNEIGIEEKKIIKLGEKDNFWTMDTTGPCGPCSEIYIDQGPLKEKCNNPNCTVNCSCGRFLELWNLVFMQFNKDINGDLTPLPKPCIDTGMGLERITSVLQGHSNNYDSDIFSSIIKEISRISHYQYGKTNEIDSSMRIIADHVRAATFLISDGISPKNEGRGYVLRRIIRRAIRHKEKLGLKNNFLSQIAKKINEKMVIAYSHLKNTSQIVYNTIDSEEELFSRTLDSGLKLLMKNIKEEKKKKKKTLSGEIAFTLYDTYGFPLELTKSICQEENMILDLNLFNLNMEKQRSRSKKSWKRISENEEIIPNLSKLKIENFESIFTGYNEISDFGKIKKILINNKESQEITEKEEGLLISTQTPFYATSGGQIGDIGEIKNKENLAQVYDTIKTNSNMILHKIRIIKGFFKENDDISLNVNPNFRRNISGNHTATHLLHSVLRDILGSHVKQAGSLVTSTHLRFDFNYSKALSFEQLKKIETKINQHIQLNFPLQTTTTTLKKALDDETITLFENRYNKNIRTVKISNISKEACGGTHSKRTGEIGLFKIIKESAVSAGIRRIEALTQMPAITNIQTIEKRIKKIVSNLKTPLSEVNKKILSIQDELTESKMKIKKLNTNININNAKKLLEKVKILNNIKVIITKIETTDQKTSREISDTLLNHLKSGIIVLGYINKENKAMLTISISNDLSSKIHAGNLIKDALKFIKGKGGGRKNMAQAGGIDPQGISKALDNILLSIKKQSTLIT